jgi:hypothetical protein
MLSRHHGHGFQNAIGLGKKVMQQLPMRQQCPSCVHIIRRKRALRQLIQSRQQ